MQKRVNVAIVGYGYWGPNLARNFMLEERARLVAICDSSDRRARQAALSHPGVDIVADYAAIVERDDVDAVAIATPVSSHFPLALAAIKAKKHVLVEKPFTSTLSQADELIKLAAANGVHTFVDHTFVFTPAVQKMREVWLSGDLGSALYYDSTRINLGIFQHDVDVIWDLAPHDLSILDFLMDGRMPLSVTCNGVGHYSSFADTAYITMTYPGNFIAHINVNWLAPVKIRQVLLCGDRKMIVYDENTVLEKIRIYDRGVHVDKPEDVYQRLVQYREGDMFAPRLSNVEALRAEVANVVETILGSATAAVDGRAGARVVAILEAASESLRAHGHPVAL